MLGFLKKISPLRAFRILRKDRQDGELWTAGFGGKGPVRFDIKSESAHDAYIRGGALALGLKKSHCLAWVEAPGFVYGDMALEARFRLDVHGAYGAAGFLFRVMDGGTYYSALVSSKGYFRLDVVRNGMPLPLVGWTELPAPAGALEAGAERAVPAGAGPPEEAAAAGETALTIIACGNRLLLGINGSWAAEMSDATLRAGELCFAAASYEEAPVGGEAPADVEAPAGPYRVEAFLESLSVDTRAGKAAALYEQWSAAPRDPRSCLRLAETFAAMGQPDPALVQLKRAWENPGRERRAGELLFAARLARALEDYALAEEYADACLGAAELEDPADREAPAGMEAPVGPAGPEDLRGPALVEKAKILHGARRYGDLAAHTAEALRTLPEEPLLHRLRGRALESLGDCRGAAAAYDRAFELDREDGSLAENAAALYEALGRKEEALERCFRAGRVFLASENYGDLGALVPRLLSLGENNWEAHGLAGKWAFGIEDWKRAEEEFVRAEKLRKKTRPRPKRDAAAVFLEGLLKIREGRRREALPLLEEAAALAPDYPLFRFRLAETRFLLSGDAGDPRLKADLKTALKLSPHDGWVHNFAAQLALSRGDLDKAADHLELAGTLLGEIPAIRVNRAALLDLRGDLEGALGLLDPERKPDGEPGFPRAPGEDGESRGLLANCAGNLLVRAGRYGEADKYYERALAAAPDLREYICNRASCLIAMGLYGTADEILARAHRRGPDPTVLELISYVAARKGEYARAETACRSALDLDPCHAPSLLSLSGYLASRSRWLEAEEFVRRLEALPLEGDAAARRGELRKRVDEGRSRLIRCASCRRSWRVPLSPPPAPPIRLFAMPPENLPAGTCAECGTTYCIGCGKKRLNEDGRFVCPKCGKPLRLMNEGLKQLVYDWAAAALPETAALSAPPPPKKRPRPP
jgi:tetratricopeptide (TPR) repeat protein